MEVEAESVAYTVCQHYGIDTSEYSFAYVAEWGSGKETPELKASLDVIRGAASEIITKVDSQILEMTKEATQDKAAETQGISDKPEQTVQSKFFGNTPYKDIPEKAYFNVSTAVAPKIIAELESQGLKFSGMNNDNSMTTFTLTKADSEKFREIEKSVTAPEMSVIEPKPQAQNNIIGNTSFKDISEKSYFKIDNDLAVKVAAELEAQGIKFSGNIKDDKTTFTLEKADSAAFKAVVTAVRTAESELKVADKFPEKAVIENKDEREAIISALLDDIQNSEPEDYGGAVGLAVIEANLREKSIDELRADYKEMQAFDIHEYADPGAEVVEANHRANISALSELETKAAKVEKTAEKIEKKPCEKKSIKARIEADKQERVAVKNVGVPEKAAGKSKTTDFEH